MTLGGPCGAEALMGEPVGLGFGGDTHLWGHVSCGGDVMTLGGALWGWGSWGGREGAAGLGFWGDTQLGGGGGQGVTLAGRNMGRWQFPSLSVSPGPHRLRAPHPELPALGFGAKVNRAAAKTSTRLFTATSGTRGAAPQRVAVSPPWRHPSPSSSYFSSSLFRPTNGLITTRWSANAGTTSRTVSTACGTPSPLSRERR